MDDSKQEDSSMSQDDSRYVFGKANYKLKVSQSQRREIKKKDKDLIASDRKHTSGPLSLKKRRSRRKLKLVQESQGFQSAAKSS